MLPSAVETNIVNPIAVKSAIAGVMSRLRAKDEKKWHCWCPIRSFAFSCSISTSFRRSPQEAEPMLRWKLKKSVPFEADETVISYMRQAPREDGVDVVTALARLRIVREYEALAERRGSISWRGAELVSGRHHAAR